MNSYNGSVVANAAIVRDGAVGGGDQHLRDRRDRCFVRRQCLFCAIARAANGSSCSWSGAWRRSLFYAGPFALGSSAAALAGWHRYIPLGLGYSFAAVICWCIYRVESSRLLRAEALTLTFVVLLLTGITNHLHLFTVDQGIRYFADPLL